MGRLRGVALLGVLALAGYWAVLGGEYSVFEVARTREARVEEEAALARVRTEIDSLAARADSLENDPGTLERLARERHGMIRDGETLYRFAEPPDSLEPGSAPSP